MVLAPRCIKAAILWVGILLPHATAAQQPASALIAKTDREATRRVAEIMDRALARDYSLVNAWTGSGTRVVEKISWVPPTNEDYADIAGLGESAVPVLATYVTPDAKPGGFVQLLAVKFLASIGTASTVAPLGKVLDQRNWQVARLCGLDVLGKMPEPEATDLVRSVLQDQDPQIAARAEEILSSWR